MNWFRKFFFNIWYYRRPPWDSGVSPPELMDFISSNPPGKALDLGCGTGTNVITLCANGWQAAGVDFAKRAVQIARKKAEQRGVQPVLEVRDVSQPLGLQDQYNLILDMGCFHSLPEDARPGYFQNIHHYLLPGGTFLLYLFFRSAENRGPGLLVEELSAFPDYLQLRHREDGTNFGERASAWLWFQRAVEG
jgi:SAM-dependent methyltransferase